MRTLGGGFVGALVVVLTAGWLGCGKQKPAPDATPSASGGAGGEGGASGVGSGGSGGRTGAGGGGGADSARLPACVRDLFAACPIEGSCVKGTAPDAGLPTSSCYSNGVKVKAGAAPGVCGVGPGEGINRVEVTKPDGSPCYSFERCAMTIDSFFFQWKDAAGTVVASGSEGGTGSGSARKVSIACAGGTGGAGGAGGSGTASCEYPSAAGEKCLCIDAFGRDGCGVNAPPSPTCTTGTCP